MPRLDPYNLLNATDVSSNDESDTVESPPKTAKNSTSSTKVKTPKKVDQVRKLPNKIVSIPPVAQKPSENTQKFVVNVQLRPRNMANKPQYVLDESTSASSVESNQSKSSVFNEMAENLGFVYKLMNAGEDSDESIMDSDEEINDSKLNVLDTSHEVSLKN
jgi:hypothetical protein